MKVCHLTSVHPRTDTRIFVKMCVSAAQAGYQTHLVVADGLGDDSLQEVSIHDVGRPVGRVKRMLKSTYAVYKKAKQLDARVYHFHDPELMPVGILLKLQGKKVVFDVHEDLPRQILRKRWLPAVLRKPISFCAKIAEHITAKIVDSVVTVTPTIAQRFSSAKVIEVRNYALLPELQQTQVEPENKSKVTYIGGITTERGIVPMVSAFANLDYEFTLAGSFQEAGLEAKTESLPGWANTNFLGWQNRAEITTLLNQSLIGLVVLQPTGDYEDAFPVKMFEYMAAGVAVIASDFPLWREIIEGQQCGLCVDPTDPKAISTAIESLLNDRALALKMGQNGIRATQKEYSWQTESTKLLSLYQSLA